jgi:hypothetical protein
MSVIHMIKAVSHNPYRYEWDQMVHFEVLIENIAFEKEVYAHVRLEGNEWFDVPLGQRFLDSNHIRRPRRACRTMCG